MYRNSCTNISTFLLVVFIRQPQIHYSSRSFHELFKISSFRFLPTYCSLHTPICHNKQNILCFLPTSEKLADIRSELTTKERTLIHPDSVSPFYTFLCFSLRKEFFESLPIHKAYRTECRRHQARGRGREDCLYASKVSMNIDMRI